jgi:hypothetical protein
LPQVVLQNVCPRARNKTYDSQVDHGLWKNVAAKAWVKQWALTAHTCAEQNQHWLPRGGCLPVLQ